MKPSTTRAMVLAAGRGERMRPLTDTCPKPLLPVQGKPLMQWPLEALARGGFAHAVVNTAWLGEQIESTFGSVFGLQPPQHMRKQLLYSEQLSGAQLQNTDAVHITYSHEGRDFGSALETAGGIARALPLLRGGWVAEGSAPCPPACGLLLLPAQSPQPPVLRDDVFWVLAGDVFAPDFVFSQGAVARFAASGKLAHLWLVPNPAHNPKGDFGLQAEPHMADPEMGTPARTCANESGHGHANSFGLALNLPADTPQPRYTYSTIGLYRSALFAPPWCDIAPGNPQGSKAALAPLLRAAMDQQQVSAELYTGRWTDVGTPERLAQLNALHPESSKEVTL
jgi:MurNAc alpha-1-phosphate uridylyltransferase